MDKNRLKYMREAGRVNLQAIELGLSMLEPGTVLKDIDVAMEELIRKNGCEPAFKGYQPVGATAPYPATACISVNDVLVHGLPGDYAIQDGDIVTVDVGTKNHGWHVDAARSKVVGSNPEAQRLLNSTEIILAAQLDLVKDGCSLYSLVEVSEKLSYQLGIYIMPQWGGHGIGETVHTEPFIPASIDRTQTKIMQTLTQQRYKREKLKEGQTICIEPVTSLGSHDIMLDADQWTVRTADGGITTHTERCLVVTRHGYEILT